jgi:hypothetical protein
MKTKTWGVFGSLAVNLILGLVIAALFSVAPAARAGEQRACAEHAATHAGPSAARPAPPAPSRPSHLVAVRMGWAMG